MFVLFFFSRSQLLLLLLARPLAVVLPSCTGFSVASGERGTVGPIASSFVFVYFEGDRRGIPKGQAAVSRPFAPGRRRFPSYRFLFLAIFLFLAPVYSSYRVLPETENTRNIYKARFSSIIPVRVSSKFQPFSFRHK